MTSLDTAHRSATLARLEREPFDLVVVGGGITGAGVAREASLRGLRVALLEANDYASGTSSRSSKLIHGGLRYLAMGDVPLVRETALERKVLHRMAPHLAEPRWMVMPVRSRAGLLKFRAALSTYEQLGAVEEADLHQNWDAAELSRREPVVNSEHFPFACAYREYLTDDARLVLANLRAAVACDAVALNYARVCNLVSSSNGLVEGVDAVCGLTGGEFRVRARCVVNAAGPWVEQLMERDDSAKTILHLSKGVHICVPWEVLPVRNLVLLNSADRRTLFAIPRGRVTYVGTTDTSYEGSACTWPEVLAEDIDYILEPIARHCTATVTAGDIVTAWAGLRPLIAKPGKEPKDLSRKDEILIAPSGVISVAGGKLTGYRTMAIRIVEDVLGVIGENRPPHDNEDTVLPGGDFAGPIESVATALCERHGLAPEAGRRLAALYGSEAGQVAEQGSDALVGCDVVTGEIEWAVSREGAVTVEDVIQRRTRAALYEPDEAKAMVAAVASRMAAILDWDEVRRDSEVEKARLTLDMLPEGLSRAGDPALVR